MSNSQIRLGLIGTGLATEKLHWPALARLTDVLPVVAFTNRTREKAEQFCGYSGLSMSNFEDDYEALLRRDDVDAVLISVPIPLNFPITRAALEAGKHVICEKPAGIDLAQGTEFVELVRRYPEQTVLIAENWFYRDDIRTARRLLDQQVLGRVHLASWRTVTKLVPAEGQFSITPWRHDPGYIGGPHLDAGVHHIAEMRMLLGDIARVYGETQHANVTHGGPSDMVLTLKFVSGAIGSYTAAYTDIDMPDDVGGLRIYGTSGVMTMNFREIRIDKPGAEPEIHKIDMQDGGYYNEFVNFVDAVAGRAELVGTVEQTWRNMQIVDAGLASSLAESVITFDQWPIPLTVKGVPLWDPTTT